MLTTGQFAEHFERETGEPVSAQTVRNWAEAGKIASTRDGRGNYRIDPAAVDAIKRTRGARKGGKRRGAGRPRKEHPDKPLGFEGAEKAAAVKADIAARTAPPAGAMHMSELLHFTPEEARALIAHAPEIALGPTTFDLLDRWLRVRRGTIEVDAAEGRLVEAAAVLSAWRAVTGQFAMALEGLGPRLASRLASVLSALAAQKSEVLDLLRAAGVDPDLVAAVDAVLAPPAEPVLRQLLDDEVRRARGALVEEWKK